MPVIKRYPNRKLYDTEAKQYITLEGIAVLIREGEDVEVIDHNTGEDLTALTLSQVILEQQKKHSGFLPYSVLTGLIQAGGDTLSTFRRGLSSSLRLSRYVDEVIERRIQRLVNHGQLPREDAQLLRDKLVSSDQRFYDGSWLDESDLERILAERGVPTREDYQRIVDQLDVLAAKLEELKQNAESL
jgi:polyhydroxyalkanoate synthesis repressor PhaR